MITTCTSCHARYRLADDKVPWRKVRVRCPNCEAVFLLDGTHREEPATVPFAAEVMDAVDAVSGLEAFPFGATSAPAGAAAPTGPFAPPPSPVVASQPSVSPAAAPAPAARVDSAVAVAEPPRNGRRPRRDKTEMLARALVSDIVVYNREARDRALADGKLLEVLGPEIKKSWELYKEKVGAGTANSTSYFKDALNEILADGRKLF
jgi:predicted Zn finger-like uncharacterized protein